MLNPNRIGMRGRRRNVTLESRFSMTHGTQHRLGAQEKYGRDQEHRPEWRHLLKVMETVTEGCY
jgi:hypothetical protein